MLSIGNDVASVIYIVITTDNVNANEAANQRGGGSQNEFSRLDTITLLAPAHLQPPIRGSNYRNLNMTPATDDTEMRFTWHSGSPTGSLRIRAQGSTQWREVPSANPRELTNRTASDWYENNYIYYVHQLSVTGLARDTVHEYQVVWDNGQSATKTFRTGGADTFRFFAVGDPQIASRSQGLRWASTLAAADTLYPGAQFIMSMGDQFATRNNSDTYNALTRSQYMHDYLFAPPQLQRMPFAPSVGNHDGWSSDNELPRVNQNWNLWHDHYNTPLDAANVRQYATSFATGLPPRTFQNPHTMFDYYYRWGNVLFIHLNSTNQADWQCRMTEGENNLRRDWFRKAVADNRDAMWKVVTFHHAPYSVSTEQWILDDIRRVWTPEFERAKIDIVFNGHDHVYARSHHMLRNERQLDQKWLNAAGEVVSTTTGRVLDPVGITYLSLNTSSGHNNRASAARPNLVVHSGVAGAGTADFSVVSVSPSEFSVVTYRISTDGSSRERIDSYSMVKSPCAVCSGRPCECIIPPTDDDPTEDDPTDPPTSEDITQIERFAEIDSCVCEQEKSWRVTRLLINDELVSQRRVAKLDADGALLRQCEFSYSRQP